MQRLIADQVDRLRTAYDRDGTFVHGFTASHHHQRLDLDAKALSPIHGSSDQPFRVLVGVSGGQYDDSICASFCDQAAVEVVIGGERAATLQCQDAAHLGERTLAQPSSTDSKVVSVSSVTPIERT